MLASRLETVMSLVLKRMHGGDEQLVDGEEVDAADDDCDGMGEDFETQLARPRDVPLAVRPGEMPSDAHVNAAQAESSLGFVLADDIDAEAEDDLEADIRAEKEAMRDCAVNPSGVAYSCLSFSLDTVFGPRYLLIIVLVVDG